LKPIDFDTILHPHRFAVVAALSKGHATVEQLKSQLPHIPQASMYRAIQKLEQAHLITRVMERQVRGTVEVTYGMEFSLSQMTMPDHADIHHYRNAAYAVFSHYVMNTLEQYKQGPVEQLNKARFNAVPLTLTEEQYDAFLGDVRDLLTTYMHKDQATDGTSFQLTTFLIPEKESD